MSKPHTVVSLEPEIMAEWLEEFLTWRQLRRMAQRHHLQQYSYLGKRYLSLAIAISAHNRHIRKHGPHTKP